MISVSPSTAAKPPSQRTRRPLALAAAARAALRRRRHQPDRARLGVAISGSRPPQKKEEAWVRTPLTDPVRQIEWRAQNRPTMLPCALRRVSSPFAPRALRRSIQIPAKFSPPALTSSLSLLPHSFARGKGEIVLDVRVLVEKWYIWFVGFERVGRKGRLGRSITHLSHAPGCLTALQNTHAHKCLAHVAV